jgi:16S rRNA G966 N2-methylase RsmD
MTPGARSRRTTTSTTARVRLQRTCRRPRTHPSGGPRRRLSEFIRKARADASRAAGRNPRCSTTCPYSQVASAVSNMGLLTGATRPKATICGQLHMTSTSAIGTVLKPIGSKMDNRHATWKTVTYGCIEVRYRDELCGGGNKFGQDFVRLLKEIGPTGRLLEWCCGAGFIGFSLLAYGLCDHLVLADINSAAIAACRETIRVNRLEDRVRTYVSDCLDGIPEWECFDMVVGNPPHSGSNIVTPDRAPQPLIYQDIGWAAHRRFFRRVVTHLAPGGQVILQENQRDSEASVFEPFIAASGLDVSTGWPCPDESDGGPYYYLSAVKGR